MAFNMLELLNNNKAENNFKIEEIEIDRICPNEDNFYSMNKDDIDKLKKSIEIVGLQQNMVVKKENDIYKIIAGHRRYESIKIIHEEDNNKFKTIPCKVVEDDEILDKIILIITNSTSRQLSDWEKVEQSKQLKEALTEYKKRENLPGRVRDIIADILKVSPTQVARMEKIDKNLDENLKEEFKNKNINISAAYEASKLNKEKQEEVYKELKEKGSIKIKDVTKKNKPKEENKEDPKEIKETEEEKGEVVQQRVPEYARKSVFKTLHEMNIVEFADFICSKCNGGNGCAGICDLAIKCNGANKQQVCVEWLASKV